MHATYALNMRSAVVEALYKRYICVVATGGGYGGAVIALKCGLHYAF